MSRGKLYALIMIALTVVVLLFNRHGVKVNLLFTDIHGMAALVYLFFIGLGVTIGLLLK